MEPRSQFHFLIRKYGRWRSFYDFKKIENPRLSFPSGVKTAAAVAGGAYVGYQMGKFTGRLAIVCFLHFSYKLVFVTFLHRFGHWGHGGGWGMREYNTWRVKDGMLCRS